MCVDMQLGGSFCFVCLFWSSFAVDLCLALNIAKLALNYVHQAGPELTL